MKINKSMSTVKAFHEFEANEEKVDAVILNLEQIGETAKKLSEETKSLYAVEWKRIIGMRNMISHNYEGVNINIIYLIATKNIVELFEVMKEVEQ